MKKKRKWKIFGFSLLGVIVLLAAGVGFGYYSLQPKNHFKSVPVVSTVKSVSITGDTGAKQQPIKQANDTFNVLIMGSDARPGDKLGHSDSILLAHIDLTKNQVDVVSIPRDTRVHLDGYGYTKLTSVQYILESKQGTKQGIEGAVNAVSGLTGVPINYYAETNFGGLQSMVDLFGGINMTVPETVTINNQVFAAGQHFVKGSTALAIARERYSAANGDYARQMAQFEILKAIGKDALSPSNISKLPKLIGTASQYLIGTNMTHSDMLSLALAMKGINPSQQVHYQQIPGTGKVMYDDILKANNDEIIVDPTQLKSIISKNFS